jgi:hypothetical protein
MGMSKHFLASTVVPDRLARRPGHHRVAGPLDVEHPGQAGHLHGLGALCPHFTKAGKTENRVIGVPDRGGRLPLGHNELWLLPAHFMHSEGNFHFYDPVSRILSPAIWACP